MPINQSYIHNKVEDFTDLAVELDLATLEELRKVTNRLTEDPDLEFEDRIRDFAENETEKWYEKTSTWINANLSLVYLRAINMQDRELAEMVGAPRFQDNPLPLARFSEHARITGEISDEAKEVLSKYPKHWDSYKRYETTFKEAMNKIRLPFRNSTVQNYRDIAALRMQPAFQEGSVATRKDLAQDVLNEFADRGINVVQFPNRKMSVEAFANREARAYMQDVAVQGQINRATQRGYDLVRINSYAGPSPMCAPHQGNVYSLSGDSSQYPPLSSAIHDGTYSYGSGIYHDYSMDSKSEAYTDEGWKFIKDLRGDEKIMSLNPDTLEPEWAEIARTHSYHHDGKMIHLTSNSFDLMVTDDHDLFIGYSGRDGDKRVRKYKGCRADKAIERAFFTQLRIPEWSGESIEPPISGLSEEEFAHLLAWYISDGCCEKPNGKYTKVCIRKEKEGHVKAMKEHLLPMGFKHSNGRFWLYNHEWAEYFSQFGKSYEKYLPKWIKSQTRRIIKIFLDAYLLGDGTTNEYTYKGYKTDRSTLYTSSKRLAEDLGECMIKGGYYPSFSLTKSKGVEVEHHNGTYAGNHDIWNIRRNKTKESYYRNSPSNKDTGLKAEVIDWDDMAYCVTLKKNNVFWVRRNGKTTWTKNCGHFQSTYIPGVSEGVQITDSPEEQRILNEMGESEGNRFIYKQRQVQQKIEYKIRSYKRRQVASLTKAERERNQKLVRRWQERMREHIDQHDFLRRNYADEALL